MKSSIKNIFNNLILFLSLLTFFSAVAILFTIDQNNSFKKVDILNQQKNIIIDLQKIKSDDIDIALIQYNGKSAELKFLLQKLYSLNEYDIIGKYILDTSSEYLSQLEVLKNLIDLYNSQAVKYYKSDINEKEVNKKILLNSYDNINDHISNIIFQNINYNRAKQDFMYKLALWIFAFILLTNIVFYNKLKNIYKDIEFLQQPSAISKKHKLYSNEADAIYLRMRRKPQQSKSTTDIDPVTGINNNKGLANSYAEKKGMKESNFTALTVIEIDTFSKTNRKFPQDFSQMALKKVANIISMYEQATDIISRTDYNEFTVILSRSNKEQAYKEIEQMRQSVEELKLATSTKIPVKLTISGGFYIKPNNVSLNNAISESKSILEHAKQKGGNRIFQKKDVTDVNI